MMTRLFFSLKTLDLKTLDREIQGTRATRFTKISAIRLQNEKQSSRLENEFTFLDGHCSIGPTTKTKLSKRYDRNKKTESYFKGRYKVLKHFSR